MNYRGFAVTLLSVAVVMGLSACGQPEEGTATKATTPGEETSGTSTRDNESDSSAKSEEEPEEESDGESKVDADSESKDNDDSADSSETVKSNTGESTAKKKVK